MRKLQSIMALAFIAILGTPSAQAFPGDAVKFTSPSVFAFKGADYDVRSALVQSDGRIILAGNFQVNVPLKATVGSLQVNVLLGLKNIVRLNADGSVDTTFIVPLAKASIEANGGWTAAGQTIVWGFNAPVRSIAFNPDVPDVGDFSIFAAGEFTSYGQLGTANVNSRVRLLQLDSAGDLTTDFIPSGAGLNNTVRSLLTIDDDTVLAMGDFTQINALSVGFAFNGTNGGDAGDWGALANGPIDFALRTADGIYFCGEFTEYQNNTVLGRLVRVDPTDGSAVGEDANQDGILDPGEDIDVVNGVLDYDFRPEGTGPNGAVRRLAVGENGTDIVLVGAFSSFDGNPRGRIARVDNTGALDLAFPAANSGNSAGANGEITSIIRLMDGRYLITGAFTTYNGIVVNGIARLEADGSLDQTFSPLAAPLTSGQIRGAVEALDGASIFLFGSFPDFKTSSTDGIVRVESGRVPVILTQPASTGVQIGDAVTLNVVVTDNYQGLTPVSSFAYQWQKNGKNIPGANSDSLTLDPTTANDGGAYRVLVSSGSYTVTSNSAFVVISNPFLGTLPTAGFRAEGIIEQNTVLNNDLGGRITMFVDRFGGASGTVFFPSTGKGPLGVPFTGQFNNGTGQMTATVSRVGQPLLTLTINMVSQGGPPPTDFDFQNGTSTLSDGVNTAVVIMWSTRWSKIQPATNYVGNYHVVLETDAAELPLTSFNRADVSQGFSYFKMGVSANTGAASVAGVLSDGTPFSGSGIIWGDGEINVGPASVPLWIPLYGGRGSLLGLITVNRFAGGRPVAGMLEWTKPAGLLNSPDQFGFTSVDLTPLAGSGLFNLASLLPIAPVTLNFDDGVWTNGGAVPGGLTAPFSQTFTISGKKATPVGLPTNGVTMSINTKTGLITGTFTDAGRRVSYRSIMLSLGGLRIRGNFIMPNSALTSDYLVGGSVSN